MKHYLTTIPAGWSLAANAGQLSDLGILSLHFNAPAKEWGSEGQPENLKLETIMMKENLQ